MNRLETVINAVQLGLTLTFILLCGALLKTWWPSVREAFESIGYWRLHRAWGGWTAEQWLGVGIALGFSGNVVDNLYWGVTWLAAQYQWASEDFLFEHGPLANIFARQSVGIVAVYCHIYAAKLMHDSVGFDEVNTGTKTYFALGLALCIALMLG